MPEHVPVAFRAVDNVRTAVRRMRFWAPWGTAPVAYIGVGRSANLGDRIVYEAARQILPGRSLIPVEGAARERRLAAVGLSGARFFRVGVLGGGTLINEYSRATVEALLDTGVAMYALGTGAGSGGWDQEENIDIAPWRELLKRFEGIGVRGPLSLAALERLGVSGAEIVGDLALACAQEERQISRCRRVMVNVIEKGRREVWNPEIHDALRRFLRRLVSQGWEVLPFAMHPDDLRALDVLFRGSGITTARPSYASSPELVITQATTSQLVISMRLHGVVLGVCGGAASVSLGYRRKCADFMQSVGLEDAMHLLDAPGDTVTLERALSECATRAVDLRSVAMERALGYRELLRRRALAVLARA